MGSIMQNSSKIACSTVSWHSVILTSKTLFGMWFDMSQFCSFSSLKKIENYILENSYFSWMNMDNCAKNQWSAVKMYVQDGSLEQFQSVPGLPQIVPGLPQIVPGFPQTVPGFPYFETPYLFRYSANIPGFPPIFRGTPKFCSNIPWNINIPWKSRIL